MVIWQDEDERKVLRPGAMGCPLTLLHAAVHAADTHGVYEYPANWEKKKKKATQ